MKGELKKEYDNGEITIVWKPGKCIHAGECVKALPKVYDPKKKPWIAIDNATTNDLKAQINKCPSGALSFYVKGEEVKAETNTLEANVQVINDGPLIVHGTINITHKDGSTETKEKRTSFCRCGHSQNKPYCDGAHKREGFVG